MNCPSRVDLEALHNGWNQNPNPLVLESNNDFNGIANTRLQRDHRIENSEAMQSRPPLTQSIRPRLRSVSGKIKKLNYSEQSVNTVFPDFDTQESLDRPIRLEPKSPLPGRSSGVVRKIGDSTQELRRVFFKFAKFIGPGFMVSVAYIDPGNYATDVAAGATYKYQLLVMILVSNVIAIFLQSLCIKLGSVTGMNLAENCKAHCPRWLNYVLYAFAEGAIIATDIAEVIGTAIALNLLIKVPLVAGCAISILDVLIILLFYHPTGSMRSIRIFEILVGVLVIGVVICFCIELSKVNIPDAGELFRGFLPSKVLVEGQGLLQACGILGATVMPHSLYLGSGLVQPRLLEYDQAHGNVPTSLSTASPPSVDNVSDTKPPKYKPSLAAIQSCLSFSIAELTVSLLTFALFVNSAILIVSGASLSEITSAQSANLFGIHDLLSTSIGKAAGTVFALALLLSGTSAGIICTIAGQMVSEGQLNWTVKPWVRRLLTRSISITPSIIIAGAVGKEGLSAALEGTQVALSVILPIVSAPLIYFTCRNKFMMVQDGTRPEGQVSMRNNWITATFAILLWGLIVLMNVSSWVLSGVDKAQGAI